MKIVKNTLLLALISLVSFGADAQPTYFMPGEDLPHEGTWLQWPHNNLYGPFYQGDVQSTFVGMANALQSGENVHIIAYDANHQNQIIQALNNASVPMTNIDFYIYPTNDVWVRDNGPIFVFDSNDEMHILDWGFNGWGNDSPYNLCDPIPGMISSDLQIPSVDLSAMILEGGAIEHDGQGTMMATSSSVTHSSRNPNLTEQEIETYLTNYMGFTNFIWLDGVYGTEITDMHIDGFVKFANDSTIVTMNTADLTYWQVSLADQSTLINATNVNNEPFNFVTVPLTQNDVVTTYGNNLGYKGSYCNYYIGNDVVVVPTYNDPNENVALGIIQSVHPNRTVVGVDVRNIYEYGGMIHCLTQQQPEASEFVGMNEVAPANVLNASLHPNPVSDVATVQLSEELTGKVTVRIFQMNGQEVTQHQFNTVSTNTLSFPVSNLADGMYLYQVEINGDLSALQRMIVQQ